MSFYQKLKKAPWLYKQPLSIVPKQIGQPVSDLFLWRNTDLWSTCFELINVPGLYDEEYKESNQIKLCIFNSNGSLIISTDIAVNGYQKKIINIGDYLADKDCESGTFSVFHLVTPKKIKEFGSFLTERGYVSYSYKDDFRSYVHGNLDAVSLQSDASIQNLGVKGVLNREYYVQHEFDDNCEYELGFVNPTNKTVKVLIKVMNSNLSSMMTEKIKLLPLGSKIIKIDKNSLQNSKVVIKSKLVMARPVVFCQQGHFVDVFHG